MNELIKEWLKTLIDGEIEAERGTIANERIWENGSDTDECISMHGENIANHERYIEVLEEIKVNYCN